MANTETRNHLGRRRFAETETAATTRGRRRSSLLEAGLIAPPVRACRHGPLEVMLKRSASTLRDTSSAEEAATAASQEPLMAVADMMPSASVNSKHMNLRDAESPPLFPPPLRGEESNKSCLVVIAAAPSPLSAAPSSVAHWPWQVNSFLTLMGASFWTIRRVSGSLTGRGWQVDSTCRSDDSEQPAYMK